MTERPKTHIGSETNHGPTVRCTRHIHVKYYTVFAGVRVIEPRSI